MEIQPELQPELKILNVKYKFNLTPILWGKFIDKMRLA